MCKFFRPAPALRGFAFGLALLCLASCETRHPGADHNAGEITISARVGGVTTRLAHEGDTTFFEAGDKMTLYVWRGDASVIPVAARRVVDGVVVSYNGSAWIPAARMMWGRMSTPHHFLGISQSGATALDAPLDSATLAAYPYTLNASNQAASDLLVARKANVLPTAGAVSLEFRHAMAKLRVDVRFNASDFPGELPTVSKVTVKDSVAATVNLLTGEVTPTGAPAEVSLRKEASATQGYSASYSGLQVPQGGLRRVVVTTSAGDYEYTPATDITLEAGCCTHLAIALGRNGASTGSISVTDWDELPSLPSGTAEKEATDCVDLGLSVKWAMYNLCENGFCANPEDYGDYWAWGETKPKADYSWKTYKWGTNVNSLTKYTASDGKTVLEANDDAATQTLSIKCRMPTDAEWTELRNNCTWTWTTRGGVNGYTVTSKKAGFTDRWIFLPAAGYRLGTSLSNVGSYGYYWSSSLYTDSPSRAWYLYFYSGNVDRSYRNRYLGLSVRPVSE